MNNNFPPNTDPNIFSFIATIVGAIICEEFNILELNSIANWFALLGQYLETYVAQAQLIQSRNSNNSQNQVSRNDIDALTEAIQKIEAELLNIKKGI